MVNADWTISITRSRFTSRYCSKLWDNFGYMEKKQSIVAIGEDMKFQTIAEGICEFIWPEILIKDLQLPVMHHRVSYGYTKSTISFVNNLAQ